MTRLLREQPAQGRRSLARVKINGRDTKYQDPGNAKIFSDALDAILECQNADLSDPDSWLTWLKEINEELAKNQVSAKALTEIEAFYAEAAELSFYVNPILAEVWRRCMDATRDNSFYAYVGGKFYKKLPEVLDEIEKEFPALTNSCKAVRQAKINKEHQINKGKKFGGKQTAAINLQYASVPPVGSKETLSEFHKGLHALKPGTGKLDFNALHPAIRIVIEKQQMLYSEDAMGKLAF